VPLPSAQRFADRTNGSSMSDVPPISVLMDVNMMCSFLWKVL
jgi:hypothetical protein